MKQHKRVLFVEENCSFRCDSTLILFCTSLSISQKHS